MASCPGLYCELECVSGLTRGPLPILILIHMASKVLRILCSPVLELLAILLMCACNLGV